jgi:hypothetical protein
VQSDPAVGFQGSLAIFDTAALHALAGIGRTSLNRRVTGSAPGIDAFTSGALQSLVGPGRAPLRELNTDYVPNSYPWSQAPMLISGGESSPRTNLENEAFNPRVWPSIYPVRALGLSPQLSYIRGPSVPVFNNQYTGGSPGYNTMTPGLGKSPFGDGAR